MSSYTPRTTIPSTTDLNWIKTTYGGYNRCILGSPSYGTGSVLANCTGYAWGRWRELLGADHNLSTGNAANWYGHTSDGYTRGSTPKLGAVACWSGGSDGAGHVAIVEAIRSNTDYDISNSAWESYYFRYQTISNNSFGSAYTFQGFIYIPLDFMDNPIWYYAKRKKKVKVIL